VAGEGPLRGLLTALQNIGTDLCVLTSVDMPLIERGQLRWLISAMSDRPRSKGLMLRHVVIEPFPSIYRRDAIHAVQLRLRSDRRSLTSLAGEPGFEVLDAPTQWDASVWTNLNSPEDLKLLE
jgi:molybdopterin-guanine dinucleotide biosynthesis protein A